MRTPEGQVKYELKQELDKRGAYHFWPVQTGYGVTTLDCLASVPLRENDPGYCYEHQSEFWGIECKRENVFDPSPRQARVMRQIRQAGGRTFIVSKLNGKLYWREIRD